MRKQVMRMSAFSLAMVCGTSAALAQDSVGVTDGAFGNAIGDAVAPHNLNEQCNSYVVDLAPLMGSWGTMWGIAPIAKASQFVDAGGNSAFFSALTSSQFLSSDMLTNAPTPSGSYEFWTGNAEGVSHENLRNNVPGSMTPPAQSNQMAYIFSEFGNTEDDEIVAGFINWVPSDASRLYVTRTNMAVSGELPDSPAFSTFGVGAIDAHGNGFWRADDFGRSGAFARLVGEHWVYRVSAAARDCDTLNVLDSTAVATPWYVFDGDVAGIHDEGATAAPVFPPLPGPPPTGNSVHVVPNCVPESLSGGNGPTVLTSNFDTEFVFDGSPAPAGALAAGTVVPGIFDIRGSVEFTRADMFSSPTSSYTAGIISKINANDASARRLAIWGILPNGAPSAPGVDAVLLTLPTSITDPCDDDPILGGNFQIGRTVPAAQDYDGTATGMLFPDFFYDNYHGAAAFRGVTSQVGLGEDRFGNNLASGVIYYSAVRDDDQPGNALVVTRFGDDGANPEFTLAAWNNYPETGGKPIYDGGNNIIGELASFEDLSANNLRAIAQRSGGGIGPSITPAGFDSYGNAYFLSPVQIFRGNNQDNDIDASLLGGDPALFPMIDTDSDGFTDSPNPERDLWEVGLVRAVYDATNFCYRLELVLRTGQIFPGQNSGESYMIDNILISGGSSLAASAFSSGNVNEFPMHGTFPIGIGVPADDPRHLGGMIVMAEITYDVDGMDTQDFPAVDTTTLPLTSVEFDALGPKDFPAEVGGTGAYEDPTAAFDPGVALYPDSNDQAYTSLLFVGNEGAAPCTPCSNVDGSTDGVVNLADLNLVLFNFGSAVAPGTNGDTNCDGQVNLTDLNNVLFAFGTNVGC